MTVNRSPIMLVFFIVCLYVLQAGADSNEIQPFSASMCLALDSHFVECACNSYESTIADMYKIIMGMTFTDNADVYAIVEEVLKYERNLTDIVSRGVCRNLTEFQTCLDTNMPNSTRQTDRMIKVIANTSQVAQVLGSTFCAVGQDLRNEVPDCLSDIILGSTACVGLHDLLLKLIMLTPSVTDNVVLTSLCPSLLDTTKCIAAQTFGCSSNIHNAVSGMTYGLMTSECKQQTSGLQPENIADSALVTCNMPIVVDVGFQLMDSQEPSPETISAMIMSVIEGACSRLAHLIDCVEHYMPTSTIFLDVFLLNMMDMNRLNANEPAIADGFCTPSKKLGFESAINCMMQPNNSASIQMCLTPELQTEFEIFDNVSEINAVDGIDIRNRFCSPVKSFVNCILDIVETKCNDTTVQTMVATGRDMLLSILRSDCGGVTDPPFVVEDGARGLSVHAFLYLLMGLVAVLVSHRL